MGSEMCIRDRINSGRPVVGGRCQPFQRQRVPDTEDIHPKHPYGPLLRVTFNPELSPNLLVGGMRTVVDYHDNVEH